MLRFAVLSLVLASAFAFSVPQELAAAGACTYTCEPCFTSSQCPLYFGRRIDTTYARNVRKDLYAFLEKHLK